MTAGKMKPFPITLVLLTVSLAFPAHASPKGKGPLEIIQLGHSTLRQTAEEVPLSEIPSPEFQKLIEDMIQTMRNASGVGLAAPQVNRSIRLFVMQSWPFVPTTVVINPRLEVLSTPVLEKTLEGCLSIQGKSARLVRHHSIWLSYWDRRGEYISRELKGEAALIAQHELDHLNGILITDPR